MAEGEKKLSGAAIRLTQIELMRLCELVDDSNNIGVPWMNAVTQAIQAKTKQEYRYRLAYQEQIISAEQEQAGIPRVRRPAVAKISVNTASVDSEEMAAALVLAVEISAGNFDILGFDVEAESLSIKNSDDDIKMIIGYKVFEHTQTKARKKRSGGK